MLPRIFKVLMLLAIMALSHAAYASNKEPIFINLATNEPDKVLMALDAASRYSEKGFPIVIYLNDKAVVLGVTNKVTHASKTQEALKKAIAGGSTVIICPSCLEDLGLSSNDLIEGIKIGNLHKSV